MDMCTVLKLIPLFKDVILSLAAIATTLVAVYGLNKWRAEQKGKARFDAARSLLSSVYNVRNNFEMVRSRWQDASEFPDGYTIMQPTDETTKANAQWFIYENRLKPLIKAMNELDTALVEGEVLWGIEVKEQGRKITQSYNRLVNSIKDLITEQCNGTEDWNDKTIKRYRQDVSASLNSEDELSQQIRSSVDYFEKLLRPYMHV